MLVVCPNFRTLKEIQFHINTKINKGRMGRVKAQIFEERGN
jgi:hypothetical protein